MKKTILFAVAAVAMMQSAQAQTAVIDTVITGPGYANNIWYSLANDNQASQPSNNWDIALATTINPQSGLASAALFNYKVGTLYAIPGSNPANFATIDTTGMVAAGELVNSDTSWAFGAFNNAPNIGNFDYGWGTYNMTTHAGIAANRVFVIKYANGAFKKLVIDLDFTTGYSVKSANLDNTGLQTKVIPLSTYASKNFVYYALTTDAIIDREPASDSWDITFTQYNTDLGGGMIYPVAGILQNQKVQVAKVHPVGNPATFADWSSQTFNNEINTIGYNWKASGPNGVVIQDSTVFFVKTKAGDLWKVIMTGFISGSGGGTGEYIFSKQKLETASISELTNDITLLVYPNPANDVATLVIDNQQESSIMIYSALGNLVYTETISGTGLQTVQVPTSAFNNGIYHVVCTANGQTVNQKLMVQH